MSATPYVGMLVTAAVSPAVALSMKDKLDDLASIVNFGALSGFLFLHFSVLARFALRQDSQAWDAHWLVPICSVGGAWLVAGLIYGIILKVRYRQESTLAM